MNSYSEMYVKLLGDKRNKSQMWQQFYQLHCINVGFIKFLHTTLAHVANDKKKLDVCTLKAAQTKTPVSSTIYPVIYSANFKLL